MANEKVFPFRPRPGPQITNNPRSISASFGDGYEEIAPDGLNYNLKQYVQNYRIVGDYDKIRFTNFIQEHGQHKAFIMYSESRQINVLVRMISCSETPNTGAGYCDFSMTVKEVVR